MDLRDEFACWAINAAMLHNIILGEKNPRMIAANAYTIAEAMIEAREKGNRLQRFEWAIRWELEDNNVI